MQEYRSTHDESCYWHPLEEAQRSGFRGSLEGVDKYWRVANYLSIGQIYLRSNPLMKEPFTREDVKHRLVATGALPLA